MPATAPAIIERIQQLFEPAGRAMRRGDAVQIRKVLDELRLVWRTGRSKKKIVKDEELARGMTFALEAVLGIVLATSGADARRGLVEGRKYALPILHALGRKARESDRDSQDSEVQLNSPATSIKKGDLARMVGMLAQNIGELVNTMKDCGLLSVNEEGPASRVAITEAGLEMLEASKPGWQVQQVEQDTLSRRMDEDVNAFLLELEGVAHVYDHRAPLRGYHFHTAEKIKPGVIVTCKLWDSPAKWGKLSEIHKTYKSDKDYKRDDVGTSEDSTEMSLLPHGDPFP